jgi:thiol-disulfide isomerase/thioredoxin
MLRLIRFVPVVLLFACGPSAPPPSAPSPALNKSITLNLPSNGGALVTVPLPNARATVLDAWGPSCVPCQKSLPALIAKRAEIEATGAKLVLVAVLADGETTEQATSTLHSWGVDAPFLVDHDGALRAEAGFSGLPSTVVVDQRGTLRWLSPPGATADDVVQAAAAFAR